MDGNGVFALFIGLLLVIAYVFPSALAAHRDCKATAGIVVVNLFLGWTFVGWVVALAWAACGEVTPKAVPSVMKEQGIT